MIFHHNTLYIQHDVRNVLENTLNRCEFVQSAPDLDLSDSTALEAREQQAAEAITDSGAKASLKRFCRKLPVGFGQCLGIGHDRAW